MSRTASSRSYTFRDSFAPEATFALAAGGLTRREGIPVGAPRADLVGVADEVAAGGAVTASWPSRCALGPRPVDFVRPRNRHQASSASMGSLRRINVVWSGSVNRYRRDAWIGEGMGEPLLPYGSAVADRDRHPRAPHLVRRGGHGVHRPDRRGGSGAPRAGPPRTRRAGAGGRGRRGAGSWRGRRPAPRGPVREFKDSLDTAGLGTSVGTLGWRE